MTVFHDFLKGTKSNTSKMVHKILKKTKVTAAVYFILKR